MRFVIIVITTTRLTMARLAAFGAYSEYQVVTARRLIPLPHPDPAFIPLMVSGLTASIALEQVGELGTGQTVLVTGTGWAKHVLLPMLLLPGACLQHSPHTPFPVQRRLVQLASLQSSLPTKLETMLLAPAAPIPRS